MQPCQRNPKTPCWELLPATTVSASRLDYVNKSHEERTILANTNHGKGCGVRVRSWGFFIQWVGLTSASAPVFLCDLSASTTGQIHLKLA